MKPKNDRDLLDEIYRRIVGGAVYRYPASGATVGQFSGALDAGDLVAEVTVKIRRRVGYTESAYMVERSLSALANMSAYPERCDQETSHKSRFGTSGWCCKPVSHAILWSDRHVTFTCAAHAEKIRLRDIVVVALPKYRLKEVKRVLDARVSARRQEEAAAKGLVTWLEAHYRWLRTVEDDNDLARKRRQKRGT